MTVKSLMTTAAVTFFAASNAQIMNIFRYPVANKSQQVDTYFGTQVSDPYRELEHDTEGTKKWVDAE